MLISYTALLTICATTGVSRKPLTQRVVLEHASMETTKLGDNTKKSQMKAV
jgi:hypothetical protein